MTSPTIHFETLDADPGDRTVLVRYWSDLLSQEMLANDLDEQGKPRLRPDGKPLRCRTDLTIGVDPAMDPQSEQFRAFIMQWANEPWFQLAEDALLGNVTPISHLVGAVSSPRIVVEREIQLRLDSFARARGYDNIVSICSYATSKVPRFAAEAQHAVDVRDAAWAACYAILGAVLAGTRPVPSLEEVVAEVGPLIAWPQE